jgi:hypothetical protein
MTITLFLVLYSIIIILIPTLSLLLYTQSLHFVCRLFSQGIILGNVYMEYEALYVHDIR